MINDNSWTITVNQFHSILKISQLDKRKSSRTQVMIFPDHSENNYPFFRVCDKVSQKQVGVSHYMGDV